MIFAEFVMYAIAIILAALVWDKVVAPMWRKKGRS